MTPSGKAVLTFDDGPDPSGDATPAVLDALDRVQARATFFLVGEQISDAPEMAEELLARGHEVGVHGQRHFRHDRVAAAESAADVEAGYTAVAEIAGAAPRFYRPPYGKMTQASVEACGRLGLEIAYWSTWGLDWEPLSHEHVVRRVLRGLNGGSIVLLHDSARYASRPSAGETAAAIEGIAAGAAERGLELTTLADAHDGRPKLKAV